MRDSRKKKKDGPEEDQAGEKQTEGWRRDGWRRRGRRRPKSKARGAVRCGAVQCDGGGREVGVMNQNRLTKAGRLLQGRIFFVCCGWLASVKSV